ncbi:PREDICTED: U-box domain-containing protein 44-like [Nicotiana attenuata]|uniref:U-box domain-containing protein 44 n=1 Tax=Nicotiana attenuata TaxID=49451 RepID=A0A1J6IRI5_NICAT|nr:PREDICTED: U-box domain-containing protein 44-like [Nicotiana attenuata]OIT07454.1 u-box domain-containing protein 44 [Nicotiana attenuata]
MSVKEKTLIIEVVSSDQQSITTTDDTMCSSQGRDSEYSTVQEQLLEFMEKLSSILTELKDDKRVIMTTSTPIQKAIESLEADFSRAKALLENSQFSPAHDEQHIQVQVIVQNLARALGLVLFASHDVVEISNKVEIETLRKEMMKMSSINKPSLIMSSDESEFSSYGREIVEEEDDQITLDVDDVVVQIKYSDDENLKCALHGLNTLVLDGMITNERIHQEDMIPVLFNRLSSSKADHRLIILRILKALVAQDDEHKEKMAEMGNLSILVKSLGRDLEEQKEAVGLLVSLSDVASVKRRVGRIQGCIVMLVAIFNGDDQMASHDAANLLNSLSGNTQYALHMAEAGYFKPLVHYLNQGSDMSKILMATALSRMELTEQNRASLGQDGAIEPLVKMLTTGNLESKQSSLNALHNLSASKANVQCLIRSGIVATLLQLLFSVTSVLMTLREPASAILAKIAAQSEAGIVLVKQDVAQQMLSLLNLTSPVIQCHLLEALNAIAARPNASRVRRKMKEKGAVRLLLPFLTESHNTKIRNGALNLIYILSNDMKGGELMEQLEEMHLNTLICVVSSSSITDDEKAAAIGILSNFPVSDKNVTDVFMRANLLPILISILMSCTPTTSRLLAENIAAILIRFTLPSDKKLQQFSADNGVINALVKLLTCGSIVAKSRSAASLAQLSQNSLALRKSRKSRWFSCTPPHPTDAFCQVHACHCSTRSTFCLVKAGAVPLLVEILQGNEREGDEAALTCLATLLQDEIWENGSNFLVKMSCVQPIIKNLEEGISLKAQERSLWILERIFRVEAYRVEYGESAQVVLIDLAQNGESLLKPTVAKLLAQLELLQPQSSYF